MPPKPKRRTKKGTGTGNSVGTQASASSDSANNAAKTTQQVNRPPVPNHLNSNTFSVDNSDEIVTDEILDQLGFEKLDFEKKKQALKRMNQLKNYSIKYFIDYYIEQSGDTREEFFKKHGDDNIKSVREVDNLRKIIQLRYGIDI